MTDTLVSLPIEGFSLTSPKKIKYAVLTDIRTGEPSCASAFNMLTWKIHMHVKVSHVWRKVPMARVCTDAHIQACAHTAARFPTLPKCFYDSFVVMVYGPSSVQAGPL